MSYENLTRTSRFALFLTDLYGSSLTQGIFAICLGRKIVRAGVTHRNIVVRGVNYYMKLAFSF